jgi:hypothetical protein
MGEKKNEKQIEIDKQRRKVCGKIREKENKQER